MKSRTSIFAALFTATILILILAPTKTASAPAVTIIEYPVSTLNYGPQSITMGPDNALWFTFGDVWWGGRGPWGMEIHVMFSGLNRAE